MAIKILIADDHELLRQGIRRVLNFEEDLKVIGEAEDGHEALVRTLVLQPDILLLDLNLPELSGLEVTRQLLAVKSKTRIIVLTIHDNDNYVLELLRNGARGYLLKDVDPDVLLRAIHVVHAGKVFVHQQLANHLFHGLNESADINEAAHELWLESQPERLTAREIEVVACIVKGLDNQSIAQALCISEKTVKNHLTHIFNKLNVRNRTQTLIYALQHKLMTLG